MPPDYPLVQVQETELVDEVVSKELFEYPGVARVEVGYNKSTLVGVEMSTQKSLYGLWIFFVQKLLCDDLAPLNAR